MSDKIFTRGRMRGINHVPLDPETSPQRLASTLDKAARYANTKITAKSTVGKPGGRGKKSKARVTKSVGRSIVGKHYSSGPKK